MSSISCSGVKVREAPGTGQMSGSGQPMRCQAPGKCQGWGHPVMAWTACVGIISNKCSSGCERAEGPETGMQLSDRQPTLFVIAVMLTNKKNEVLCGLKNLVIDYFCGCSIIRF